MTRILKLIVARQMADVRAYRLAQVGFRRTLRLADLTTLDEKSPFRAALGLGSEAYVGLRDVAATLHGDQERRFDGLIWGGRQLDTPGMQCVVLFGDRVSGATDLALIDSLELAHGAGRRALKAAAALRRYRLPSALMR